MKVALVALIGLFAAGCVTSAGNKPKLAPPPPALVKKCPAKLAKWPGKDLTQAQVEFYGNKDAAQYQACAARHNGLVDFVKNRDAAIQEGR